MHKPKKNQNYLLFTLLYVVMITVVYLLPATYYPSIPAIRHFDLGMHGLGYGLFTWLALGALGSCPLRWRSIAPWVFVMAFAHAYWIEFLQGILPQLNHHSSYIDLLAGSVGAMVGILLRLRYSYRKCNCSLMSERSERSEVSDLSELSERRELSERGEERRAKGEEQREHNEWLSRPTSNQYPVTSNQQPVTSNEQQVTSNQYPVTSNHHPAYDTRTTYTIADHPGLNGIIARSFGWKPMQLMPAPGISIEMVCTGKSLVSLPHFSYGSVKISQGYAFTTNNYQKILSGYALPRNIAQMELRQAIPALQSESEKTASWLSLSDNFASQMQGFNPNQRRKISKGYRNGFSVKQGKAELLSDFWNVYARHMDKLGSVALPKKFFTNLLNDYTQGSADIFILYYQENVVGGAFNLSYKGFCENGWFATLHSVQGLYASYVLHHAMIGDAINNKCHTYSFGRSTSGSGVHCFKQQWGAKDVPLMWAQYPAQKLNLRKQGWLGIVWKLLPWPVRQYGGRYLAKWIY